MLAAIGVVSVTIAAIGLLAVLLESAATDDDARYVTESVLVRSEQSTVTGEISQAKAHLGTYRRMMAEADAVAVDDATRAEELRAVARSYIADHSLTFFLTGSEQVNATLDIRTLTEVLQHQTDGYSVPAGQPASTRRSADALHTRARVVEGCGAGVAIPLVLLTFARISPTKRGRVIFLLLSASGYLALVTTALVTFSGSPR